MLLSWGLGCHEHSEGPRWVDRRYRGRFSGGMRKWHPHLGIWMGRNDQRSKPAHNLPKVLLTQWWLTILLLLAIKVIDIFVENSDNTIK
jgi:hypothetical protein